MILSRLKVRPMRYGELRHDIPSLSDKILTERLRDLCEAGFVRQERSGSTSRYCLTRRGEMLKRCCSRSTIGARITPIPAIDYVALTLPRTRITIPTPTPSSREIRPSKSLAAARTSRFDRSDNPAVAGGEIAMAPTCRAPDA